MEWRKLNEYGFKYRLTLLNDVTIKEDELSNFELNEIEKKEIHKNVMKNIKPKTYKRKVCSAAAAAVMIIGISVSFANKDVLANMISNISSISIVPGVGEVEVNDTGMALKETKTNKDVSLDSLYIDSNKIKVSFTVKGIKEYNFESYELKDSNGKIYKLELKGTGGDERYNTTTYYMEYNGAVEKSDKYILNLINNKVSFSLNEDDFKKILPSKNLYSITNGITTLNITSIRKEKDELKVDYYFTGTLSDSVDTTCVYNCGSLKDREDRIEHGLNSASSTVKSPYFILSDEYGNSEIAYSGSVNAGYFDNESVFSLKNIKGSKMKISLQAVVYQVASQADKKDFSLEINVPSKGKEVLNTAGEYHGLKYNIVSIERLSDKSIALEYKYINEPNSKLQVLNLQIGSWYNYSGSYYDYSDGTNKAILESNKVIGDKFLLDQIYGRYASVGPFEKEINLNDIK